MKSNRNEVFLAALLHDIGKFYQRADEKGVKESKYLNNEIKNLESTLCPVYKNKYSHKHVLWTAQFFKDFESHFRNLLGREKGIALDTLMRLAAAHHKPAENSLPEKIIQKADHYASGLDRSNADDTWQDIRDEHELAWDSYKKIRMRSIFEGISLNKPEDGVWLTEYHYTLPMKPLSITKDYFPENEVGATPDYSGLWNSFISEFKFLQTDSFRSFSNTLLFLLEKYTGRIPASTQHLPDVSLFDHAKMTAAFAVCLNDYIRDKGSAEIPGRAATPFLLVGGDLSGIQRFIYGIIAKGAAKNLKGRSFYLQLLIDNLTRALIDKLGLYEANIVYSSGGGFYILAPNTDTAINSIREFKENTARKLFESHRAELSLSIDFIPFGEYNIIPEKNAITDKDFPKNIGNVWHMLYEKLGKDKARRFKCLVMDYDPLFEPGSSGGDKPRDAITGEEIARKDDGITMDGVLVSKLTHEQIRLGQKLRDVDYWMMADEKLDYFDFPSFEPSNIGKHNYFLTRKEIQEKEDKLRLSADRVRIMAINDTNFLETPQKGIENIFGFQFYGGNKYPLSRHKGPKTFEELCGIVFRDEKKETREKAPGFLRMGVLRMDVDNLGAIFRNGISPDKRSFSRYSTLSRSLDYFFKGYLNAIWEENEQYREYTQIIYSGGDDLFIVGKWDTLIEMAHDIQKSFAGWTCHNPELSISGGIAFVYPKFPVLAASIYSGNEENNAKNHEYAGQKKNSFSLFGFAFEWEHEYHWLVNLKEEIKALLKNEKLSSGFSADMYHLMIQAGLVKNESENAYRISNYQVVWLVAYNFKRAMKNTNAPDTKAFLDKWINLIFTGKIPGLENTMYHPLQYLAIAARWAGMELR
ncbi:MAG: type III-A CRISPR-associated protein Cas10/Csm1 [Bacteroidales bacterium]|nr:type III-A CRISPR-associated protein Cas10/Csm1 [Bacteroidales bacterium]